MWKKLLIVVAVLVFLPVAAALAATAAVYSMGTIRVDVDVEEGHFVVPVPAGLVSVAARFAPPEMCRELEDHSAAPQWDAVRAAAVAIRDMPDAVIVEVESRDERVTVSKESGRLVVDVRTESEHIGVSIPSGLVASVTRSLERTCS